MKPSKALGDDTPSCSSHDHPEKAFEIHPATCERAAAIFRALGEPQRLRLLLLLEGGARCVSDIAKTLDEPMTAVSQRLRVLKNERIVRARRDGKHVFYALADHHIANLITNGVDHAMEHLTP